MTFFEEWFGRHAGREVWRQDIHDRQFIDRYEELEYYVQYCMEMGIPAWVSVQPFQERDVPFGLEKLYFDFDCKEDLSRAWKDAKAFSEAVAQFYNAKPLLLFSGNKGYHVYIFLARTVYFQLWRTEFVKEVYEELQQKILKGLKLPRLDKGVIGDVKRLARVPYSFHEKSGKQCAPVDLEGNPITVETLEPYRENGLDTKLLETICKEVVAKKKWQEIRAQGRKSHRFDKTSGRVRACIEAALSLPLHTGAGHKMRIAVAAEYLHRGASVDQVVELFKSQVDFGDGSKTRYYVQDIARKGYKPFRCETIRELGFCLSSDCPLHKKRKRK